VVTCSFHLFFLCSFCIQVRIVMLYIRVIICIIIQQKKRLDIIIIIKKKNNLK
jgi:hypothetical protein